MQKILSRMRMAVDKYEMIKKGDRVAVGVSGGKDSLVLLSALAEMRRFSDFDYSVTAITIDSGLGDPSQFEPIAEFCKSLDIEYKIVHTDIAEIVFGVRKEENPCHRRESNLFDF